MIRGRWASVATIVGAGVVALAMLWVVIRGRMWATIPFLLAFGVLIREVRYLQRRKRPTATFDAPDRRQPDRRQPDRRRPDRR